MRGSTMASSASEEASPPGTHTPSLHTPQWAYVSPRYKRPFPNEQIKLFDFLPDNATLAQATAASRFHVVLGSDPTPQLKELIQGSSEVLLIFEPSEQGLEAFIDATPISHLTRAGLFVLGGEPKSFTPSLQDSLPAQLFRIGHPVFFVSDRIRSEHPQWAERVISYLETLYYRHVIYNISSHNFKRSLPFRDIHRELYFDQQIHLYQNALDLFTRPDIGALEDIHQGQTAILVAAGPALEGKLDYIRANNERAVVICANSALKPLTEAGISPHYVLINDNSLDAGETLRLAPPCPETFLVGHCLSDLDGDTYAGKYLFGEHLPELFGSRQSLELHGSVISGVYSLALHMGCTRCIFIGTQLASGNPWGLEYARGSTNHGTMVCTKPLTNMWPQRLPVTMANGKQGYTTLNFHDAALWLCETIRESPATIINTTTDSLLYGENIQYDPFPDIPTTEQINRLPVQQLVMAGVDRAIAYLESELHRWKDIAERTETLLALDDESFLPEALMAQDEYDRTGITFLLERFDDYNSEFQQIKMDPDKCPLAHTEGSRYYQEYLLQMASRFMAEIEKQLDHVRSIAQ